jgi:hypothetical protein
VGVWACEALVGAFWRVTISSESGDWDLRFVGRLDAQYNANISFNAMHFCSFTVPTTL